MDKKRKLYNSKDWKKMSKNLRALQPLCVMCLKKNKITATKVADHIIPWNTTDEFLNNKLQGLCIECHTNKTFYIDKPIEKRNKLLEVKVMDV